MKYHVWNCLIVLSLTVLLVSCGRPAPDAAAPTTEPTAQATAQATASSGSTSNSEKVARLDDKVLTRSQLDQRIALIEKGLQAQPQQTQLPSKLDIERDLVRQFIDQEIVFILVTQKNIDVDSQAIDTLIAAFRERFSQGGQTLDQVVQDQLGFAGEQAPEFREFVSSIIGRQKLGETLVATDTVRQTVTERVQAQMEEVVDQVHSAHILVKTEEEANQVLERLGKGETFEALAKEVSQDPGSAQTGGDLGWAARGQFVPPFEEAIFDELKPGETTKSPVKSDFGYHIIKVLEREERPRLSEEQGKALIEEETLRELQQQRVEAVEKLITDERQKAKAEGRLEEPVYPDPTAQPTIPPQPTP